MKGLTKIELAAIIVMNQDCGHIYNTPYRIKYNSLFRSNLTKALEIEDYGLVYRLIDHTGNSMIRHRINRMTKHSKTRLLHDAAEVINRIKSLLQEGERSWH